MERARWNRYGEGANLQGHVFRDRVNPIAVPSQGEEFVQIEARRGPCLDFQLCEGRAKGTSGVMATETGATPAGKGEPAMGVSARCSGRSCSPKHYCQRHSPHRRTCRSGPRHGVRRCKSAFRADLQAISTAAVRDELPFSSASDQRRAIPISGTPSMHYQFSRRFRLRFSATANEHSTTCIHKF